MNEKVRVFLADDLVTREHVKARGRSIAACLREQGVTSDVAHERGRGVRLEAVRARGRTPAVRPALARV